MRLGSLRVSKGDDQSPALQRRALAQAGVERFFEETASGGRWDRPVLHRLLKELRVGDVVVVWKLDRLSRSLKDLLVILDRIEHAGAGFRSLTEAVDTTLPAGRMMMQMVGAFAEFERAMIRERTRAGLEAARRKAALVAVVPSSAPINAGTWRRTSSLVAGRARRWLAFMACHRQQYLESSVSCRLHLLKRKTC